MYESLLHLYLGFLGYSFEKDRKLNEWFEDNSEVIDVFNLSFEELCDQIWENRQKIFGDRGFEISSRKNYTYRLFEFLYRNRKESFCWEQYKVSEDGGVFENNLFKEVDKEFWEIYIALNPFEAEIPYICSEENLEIIKEFLSKKFYRTKFFNRRLEMYCKFCDYYQDNLEVLDILNYTIINPRFKQFYDYFGTQGCMERSYRESVLLGFLENNNKEKLTKEVYLNLKPGDRYPSKDLRIIVGEMYERLGITKTPKVAALKDYFKLSRTRITLPDKTVVNGFRLDSL